MNILIIMNAARDYHRYFNRLAVELKEKGCHVEIAVDSEYSYDICRLENLDVVSHKFSDFFSEYSGLPDGTLRRYSKFPLGFALLPDFERAEVTNIWKGVPKSWYSRLQAALMGFFEKIIVNSNIDVVLYENVSNTFAYSAWLVCQNLGVAYRGLVCSRLPGRFEIVDGPFYDSEKYRILVNKIRLGEVEIDVRTMEWVRHYLSRIDTVVPDYMGFNGLDKVYIFKRYINSEKIDRLKLIWRHRKDKHTYAFQIGNPIRQSWGFFSRNISRAMKIRLCKKYYSSPVAGERYLLYPLHYHPESSTSVHAPMYIDEYNVIRNIAFSLPAGINLYVKDHISAYGFQPLSFYKKLRALPNVTLLGPFENTKELIKGSAGVITLTSTVGYEALLLNKRVFLFGDVFYAFHPNVVKIDGYTKLFEILSENLDSPLAVGGDYNIDFVTAYFLGTYPGVLNFSSNELKIMDLHKSIFPYVFAALRAASRIKLDGSGFSENSC